MTRLLAWAWLAVVLVAGGYLALRVYEGLSFRTDLLALLPREEQDPLLQQANEAVTRALGRRVLVLVGDASRDRARAAADALTVDLAASGLVTASSTALSIEQMKRLGALYFPHRRGLLSDGDRALLAKGDGEAISLRALSQAFGFVGLTDAGLLRNDPFLLLPAFFTNLPFPLSRVALDDGMLTATDQGLTWIVVNATLSGEPFELNVQERFIATFGTLTGRLEAVYPGLQVRRLGAVFFAAAGAQSAMAETSIIGTMSFLGTVLLIVLVFRRATPLAHNILALGVGIAVGTAGSLALFGELHVAALLFGTSLIGVAVDYGLHYSACLFDPQPSTPQARLDHILPAITLGLLTTLIGYATLMLAPFPGLRQIAAFSILGLIGAFATVVLWLPRLDRSPPITHGARLIWAAGGLWAFWDAARLRPLRLAILGILAIGGIAGLARLHTDDDVRRLQSLAPALLHDQADIQRITGTSMTPQFLLVQAADSETALRREETLARILDRLKADGVIAGFQAPAAFVPSAQRQAENRALVEGGLERPLLAGHLGKLGLIAATAAPADDGVLTLVDAMAAKVMPLLDELVLAPGLHAVLLQGLTEPATLKAAIGDLPGVRLVDPTADFSALLGKYRDRALILVAISALLMLPALIWRYGWRGAVRAMLPPIGALVLAVGAIGLAGQGFTFFHAMALVLVLSIGVDYAIFCAESGSARDSVTMLAIWLATLTTQLSFGLLYFTSVTGVQNFGFTMLVGMSFALFLAPLARRTGAPRHA